MLEGWSTGGSAVCSGLGTSVSAEVASDSELLEFDAESRFVWGTEDVLDLFAVICNGDGESATVMLDT